MTALTDLIRVDPPLFYGATAVYPYKEAIEKKYRFTSRFGEEVLLHKVNEDYIELPRALCPIGGKDERVEGEIVEYPKGPTPRPNQVKLFGQTAEFLLAGQSGIVCAQTGWGKTVLGYHAAFVTQRKTLVITTKDDIYQQWFDGACGKKSPSNPNGMNFLGLQEHEVGEIRQDKCEIIGTKFVVAMIHSLSIDGKYPDWIDKEFGLVIFDEVHRVPADQFSAVAPMFRAKLRLGLSATPDRADGKELVIYSHIGPVRASSDVKMLVPKVLRFKTAWQCPRHFRIDKETGEKKVQRIPHEPGKTTHIEKMMAADSERNHRIASAVQQAYSKGRRIVVFSTLLDHLRSLHRAVVALGVPGKETGFYIGTHSKAEKDAREKVKVKPVIFSTYSMMSEGTDIPWLDTCVLAIPRSNVVQPVGRIRREYDDKKWPIVMDFVDEDSPVFLGYSRRRAEWYAKLGAEVMEMA